MGGAADEGECGAIAAHGPDQLSHGRPERRAVASKGEGRCDSKSRRLSLRQIRLDRRSRRKHCGAFSTAIKNIGAHALKCLIAPQSVNPNAYQLRETQNPKPE